MMATKAFLGLFGAVALAGATATTDPRPARPTQQPNFIFIITDDQDLRLGSLDHQPKVRKHLIEQGTTVSKHYCTVAICCPSRVSLLTGRAAHNTNVTDVKAPYGGYPKFLREGWNENYLPVWLQDAGYNTFYTGKLMNGHSTSTWNAPYANGWTGNDSNTYIYYNVTTGHNRDEAKTWTGHYSTDLAASSSLGFLNQAITSQQGDGKPFFLGVAPIGPHAETIQGAFNPPVPAERHKDLFPDLKAPRTPNFNPDVASGGGWIKEEAQANQTVVDYWDNFYRQRIRSLQAVDELVEGLIERLEKDPDVLANTYIMYTSDNGYHVGQHRLPPGKTCAIEEDINVPFVIRGPGVAQGAEVSAPTSHTDIVPTLFRLAGIALQDDFDGVPMPVTEDLHRASGRRNEHINVEFWGASLPEGAYPGIGRAANNTYKSLRILGEGYDISYTVWCTNEHELYDMKHDPWQMENIYGTPAPTFGWDTAKLTARIDALLLTLKSCKGRVCRQPWETLHPQGGVHNLRDAMAAQYDHFYLLEQAKVAFSACMPGYLPAFEGPLGPVKFEGNSSKALSEKEGGTGPRTMYEKGREPQRIID